MKPKTLTIFGILAAIVCIAARTVTLMYATESETGFFISRLSAIGIILTIGIFAVTLVVASFAFTVKKKAKNNFTLSKKGGIICIILGVALLSYCFGFGIHPYNAMWQHILELASGILCAVWFIIYGLSPFVQLKLPEIFAVIVPIHWILRLIVVFGTFSTTALVAEHIFSLAALSVTAVFMLEFSKAVLGIAGKKVLTSLYPTAICSAVLSLTSSVSRLIVTILSAAEKIHAEVPIDIVGITVGIFMLIISADIFNEAQKEEKTNEIQC